MIKWKALILTILFIGPAFAQEKLFWHEVRLDSQKKLLSWSKSDSPYQDVIYSAWSAFKNIPEQSDGYKPYFIYPVFYGPKETSKKLYEGRDWTHNPACLFAMLTDGAMLYYAYSGDSDVIPLVHAMLYHFITYGSTEQSDDWSSVPYASSDGGNPCYRGATDARYNADPNYPGRGDGVGFIEPDKVGELGLAYLRFYEFTLEDKFLKAGQKCADALVKHVRAGDESFSPWPFRVDAKTGKVVKEQYTSNVIGPIRLLDEVIKLGVGDTNSYSKTRQIAFDWLMKYPMQNDVWTQYFEDIYNYPDYRTNINQYCPMETARYLLENPQYDSQWRTHAKHLIDWVAAHFASDSHTMAGLPEKGVQWGAEAVSEQINDMDKMTSHTSRFASVLALYYEKTGDQSIKKRAFRSFNWASYGCRQDGLVKTSIDEGTGYWFSDGYGDYMRHFQRGMASVPEWAPAKQNHLLQSSSIVRSIKYTADKIVYNTFDSASNELLKLSIRPQEISLNGGKIPQVDNLEKTADCYTVESVKGGGFAVRIRHNRPGNITILLKK